MFDIGTYQPIKRYFISFERCMDASKSGFSPLAVCLLGRSFRLVSGEERLLFPCELDLCNVFVGLLAFQILVLCQLHKICPFSFALDLALSSPDCMHK